MPLETWIDELCKLWGTIEAGKRQNVKSFRLFERADFPAVISVPPVTAVTFIQSVSMQYGTGSPALDFWRGFTEFHVAKATDKTAIAETNRFFTKIMTAAKAHMKLNGKVDLFLIGGDLGEPAIEAPVQLRYGEKSVNIGLVVHWFVFEDTSGAFTVSA